MQAKIIQFATQDLSPIWKLWRRLQQLSEGGVLRGVSITFLTDDGNVEQHKFQRPAI